MRVAWISSFRASRLTPPPSHLRLCAQQPDGRQWKEARPGRLLRRTPCRLAEATCHRTSTHSHPFCRLSLALLTLLWRSLSVLLALLPSVFVAPVTREPARQQRRAERKRQRGCSAAPCLGWCSAAAGEVRVPLSPSPQRLTSSRLRSGVNDKCTVCFCPRRVEASPCHTKW